PRGGVRASAAPETNGPGGPAGAQVRPGVLHVLGHGGRGGHGLTGETEQRRLNGEDNSLFLSILVFSVRSPFLRFSCASVLSVISVSHFWRHAPRESPKTADIQYRH